MSLCIASRDDLCQKNPKEGATNVMVVHHFRVFKIKGYTKYFDNL